jgi:hypothetical protein
LNTFIHIHIYTYIYIYIYIQDQPRNFRTKIINKLFVQKPNGKYDMNLSEPLFEEHKTMYSRKYGKDEQKALPKSVMKGLYSLPPDRRPDAPSLPARRSDAHLPP